MPARKPSVAVLVIVLAWTVVARIELDRSAALSYLDTQIEILAGRSAVNTIRLKTFQREIERRENRCFHWGGRP